jgi:hypothetical protein
VLFRSDERPEKALKAKFFPIPSVHANVGGTEVWPLQKTAAWVQGAMRARVSFVLLNDRRRRYPDRRHQQSLERSLCSLDICNASRQPGPKGQPRRGKIAQPRVYPGKISLSETVLTRNMVPVWSLDIPRTI